MSVGIQDKIVKALMGFASGAIISDAVIPALKSLNSPWYIWILLLIVLIPIFLAAVKEALYGGIGFALAFLLIGLVMADIELALLGILACIGSCAGAIKRCKS